MGNYFKAAGAVEFQGINKKKVVLEGQEIMLAKVGGNYYAIANRCAHMGGDLSAGKLEGNIITCPRHGSQYDITDGHNVRWLGGSGMVPAMLKPFSSPRPVQSYKVKLQGDDIMVEI
jgi:3-phenylpropionate/trans-cinnamate dioxygenase ferredoxin component